jgi:hypothetical protein
VGVVRSEANAPKQKHVAKRSEVLFDYVTEVALEIMEL